MRPLPNSYPFHFDKYINLIPEEEVIDALNNQEKNAAQLFESISEEQSLYKYAEKKWTVKEVLQHVIDCERIFTYRALSIARKDSNILPSFNENQYAANAEANKRSWKDLLEEFITFRRSTILLFRSFEKENLLLSGQINDYQMSVLALGFTIAGHAAHHISIIKERYLGLGDHVITS